MGLKKLGKNLWEYFAAAVSHFWKSVKKVSATTALSGLSLWLAIFSLFASMHADVFEQEENRLAAMSTLPFKRLFNADLPPINLSTLLPGFPSIKNDTARPLYIFILDTSKSMEETKVSTEEIRRYLNEIKSYYNFIGSPAQSCIATEAESNGFQIAKSELCRYIDSLPDGSLASLWTFGSESKMVVPNEELQSGNKYNGNKYIEINKNSNGGSTKGALLEAVINQPSSGTPPLSDFTRMLETVKTRYQEEIESTQEVHFVVISDFALDLGGLDRLGLANRLNEIEISRYRVSLADVKHQLKEMTKNKGKMFHLASVQGARQVVFSVLPLAKHAIEWEDYREIRIEPDQLSGDFDFLRAYEENPSPITFFYSPGAAKPYPLTIDIDDLKHENTKLRISLASTDTSEDHPLGFVISTNNSTGVLRFQEAVVSTIQRKNDKITLEPISPPTPGEAGKYRILLAWHKEHGGASDNSLSKTFYSRIEFKRRLDLAGALGIVVAVALSLIYLSLLVYALWRDLEVHRRNVKQGITNPA